MGFIEKIGSAVLGFFRSIDGGAIWNSLKITGIGYLGIFLVTGIIIGAVYLLNRFTGEKEEKE